MDHTDYSKPRISIPRRLGTWAAWISIAIVAYYLVTEHLQHLYQYLPLLFLLSCPLMHLFMHHDHKEHEGHTASAGERPR